MILSTLFCTFLLNGDIPGLARSAVAYLEAPEHTAEQSQVFVEVSRLARKEVDELTHVQILFEMQVQTRDSRIAAEIGRRVERIFVKHLPFLGQLTVEAALQTRYPLLRKMALETIDAGIRAGLRVERDKGNRLPELAFLTRLYAEANKLDVYPEFLELIRQRYAGAEHAELVRLAIEESTLVRPLDLAAPPARLIDRLAPAQHSRPNADPLFKTDILAKLADERRVPETVLARHTKLAGQFVRIEPGLFTIGSPEGELLRKDNERQREVAIDKPYEIQATLVTQLEYFLVMGENPSEHHSELYSEAPGEFTLVSGVPILINHPVDSVPYVKAAEFAMRLSELDAEYNYDLPTEVQWEVAARAGNETAYPWASNDPYVRETEEHLWSHLNAQSRTHNVGALKPNAWGIHDALGHLLQWTKDPYNELGAGRGDRESTVTHTMQRTLRGSSYGQLPRDSRFAGRVHMNAFPGTDLRQTPLWLYRPGLRLVRTPK